MDFEEIENVDINLGLIFRNFEKLLQSLNGFVEIDNLILIEALKCKI